jgi:hypothetical protein
MMSGAILEMQPYGSGLDAGFKRLERLLGEIKDPTVYDPDLALATLHDGQVVFDLDRVIARPLSVDELDRFDGSPF